MSAERTDGRHREVWELIPWYVNATLSPAEARRVEDHLADCPRCRREVAAQEEMADEVRAAGDEELPPLPHRGAERLLGRVDALGFEAGYEAGDEAGIDGADGEDWMETGRVEVVGAGGARRDGEGVLPWWLPAAGLAAMLLAAAGLAGWGRGAAPADAFHTLTDEPSVAVSAAEPGAATAGAAGGGVRVRLVFAPGTREGELRRLLLAEGGSLVAGPSPYGVYTVRFPRPDAGRLDRLRDSPLVAFAEPVAARAGGAEAAEVQEER